MKQVVAGLAHGGVGRYAAWLLATILLGAYLWKLWYLALTNATFAWHLQSAGPLASVLTALLSCASALLCVLAFALLAQMSRPAFVVALVAACSLCWLLYPTNCDMHESFLDRPNKTCTCTGATLRYYPEGVYDGTEVEYCIGLDRALRARFKTHV